MIMIDNMKAGFVYNFTCLKPDGSVKWQEEVHNLLPNVSVAYIMAASLAAGAQFSNWYVGIYENDYTPVVTDDMTSAVTSAVESTAYAETSRHALVPDTITAGVFSNLSTPIQITFTAATTIRGGFITSGLTRGNTTGLLLSIVALPSAKTMDIGEILQITAGMSLTTV